MKRRIVLVTVISFLMLGLTTRQVFADDNAKKGIALIEKGIKEMEAAIKLLDKSMKTTNAPHALGAINHVKEAIKSANLAIEHAEKIK